MSSLLSLILVPLIGALIITIKDLFLSQNFISLDVMGPDVVKPLFFRIDKVTPEIEGLEELHNNIMFYSSIILFAVSWIMLSIILNYRKVTLSSHGTLLIWIVTLPFLFIVVYWSTMSDYFATVLSTNSEAPTTTGAPATTGAPSNNGAPTHTTGFSTLRGDYMFKGYVKMHFIFQYGPDSIQNIQALQESFPGCNLGIRKIDGVDTWGLLIPTDHIYLKTICWTNDRWGLIIERVLDMRDLSHSNIVKGEPLTTFIPQYRQAFATAAWIDKCDYDCRRRP